MKARYLLFAMAASAALPLLVPPAFAAGNPEHGAQVFRACAACHSLEPGRHMTGPSLANVYGRKAGTAPGFGRYSKALEESGLVWNEKTLDAWLADPAALVPGNLMSFPGIRDAGARAELIALLQNAAAGKAEAPPTAGGHGMMGAPRLPDLEQLPAEHEVKRIRYCGDSYFVTLASGETVPFWEFNLRFKTDSDSKTGPAKGKPVLIPAGMRGDRAAVIFSSPEEIGRTIEARCE